jgi:NAD-dependent dihydropyrimidine dehydrogenase PreA subunit
VAAALAHLASQELPIVLADADVDAANLELVLDPTKLEEHVFMGGEVAVIDPDRCTLCGHCCEVCRFEAIILGDGGPAHTEIVRLLVRRGADVNLADREGTTPLAHATRRGYREIAAILTAAGAR